VRRLLRQRDARILFAGQTLGTFGDRAMLLAMAVWVRVLTGSPAAAGLLIFAIVAPYLLAPLAGMLADRVPRRRLMITTDLAMGSLVLVLLAVRGPAQVWLIYLVAGLYGVAGTLLDSSQSALLTVMVPADLLGDLNGLLQSAQGGLRLVAPAAGVGIYAAWGGGTVAAVDAGTFGISALCLALLQVREPAPPPEDQGWLTEGSAGLRHLFATVELRRIVLAVASAMLVVGFLETLAFVVLQQELHRPPTFLGVLSPAQGAGAVLGGLVAGAVRRRVGDVRLVGLGLGLVAAGVGLMLVPVLTAVVAGSAVGGLGIAWGIVGITTAIQTRTPARLQGRAAAGANALVSLPQTVSIALGAALSTIVPYRVLLLSIVAVCAGGGLFLTMTSEESPGTLET
jgi:MFS family permease